MDDLIKKLNSGPKFLFLGQEYLTLESNEDLFLKQFLRKYGSIDDKTYNYDKIFSSSAAANPEEAYAWMLTRCLNIPVPQPMETISLLDWNGIFSSAIDNIFPRSFMSEWRDVQPIFDEKYIPSDARSKSRLNIWFLFGSLIAPGDALKPPLSKAAFWSNENRAVIIANRIIELITPIGLLCIDGYSANYDWFSPDKLFPIVNSLMKEQVHLFSAKEEHLNNERISHLISNKKLVLHEDSLVQFLHTSAVSNKIRLGIKPEDVEFGRLIKIEGNQIEIPPTLIKELFTTCTLLTENIYLPVNEVSDDREYLEFKNFLLQSSLRPQWDGISRGFAFYRNYEVRLKDEIESLLSRESTRKMPLILKGQTGTGKSVALSHLAFDIQRAGKYPVIFIEKASRRMKREIIDKFCEWAENKGASATLIIWDGMQPNNEYIELHQYLSSRGRNFLLVGSGYKIPDEDPHDYVMFEAPAEFEKAELEGFSRFIGKYDPSLSEYILRNISLILGSFLVFLYRLLPATRTSIRAGLEQELSFTEATITEKALNEKIRRNINTAMATQLEKAGLIDKQDMLSSESYEFAGESITELRELIGLVMIPGQFNLDCPFELLIRSIEKGFSDRFLDILKSVDLFCWNNDGADNIQIGARSALEAELIVQQRIGGPQFEIEYVEKLISSIYPSSLFQTNEINFAIELLQSIGPNGRKPYYYKPYFGKIAHCLEKFRSSRQFNNPRFLLQESMFNREHSKELENTSEQFDYLKKSSITVQNALSLVDKKPQNRQFRSFLFTELASTYGSMAMIAESENDKMSYVQQAFENCIIAYHINPQNIHPIITLFWISKNILDNNKFSDEDIRYIEQTVFHTFNLSETESYEFSKQEQILSRQMELLERMGKRKLSDEIFDSLLRDRSSNGIYIRASNQISFIYNTPELSNDQRQICSEAYRYLVEYEAKVNVDCRYLFLMFKTWWAWKTGHRLFHAERMSLPFTDNDWSDCRKMIARILSTDEFTENLNLQYLEGVSCFHLNDFSNGFDIFTNLERESISYARRIYKYLLWSDANGNPRTFNGTVVWINEKGKGEMHIHEIQKRIGFMVHDTGRADLQKGDALSNFHIAFSMRGPIADFRS